ncbi:DUF3800 domain-containing protein [Sneathiella aquimaris]|jgi:hypothetical protein|uniref:DUF3800 domain-containing protein n=1 Tax=Sneathiella aquimaris TaxID=2599305 RepID=UPI00146B7F12|nr:DUF3800 domain-containing protein [Sneathiella aquimaris]
MKFIYLDESGSQDQGDVFVTCGLMVDAYKLRTKTAEFDEKLAALFDRHPGIRSDLKTSRFINGRGAWRQIDAQERKDFLSDICSIAVANGGKIFGIGISFDAFNAAAAAGNNQPFANSYWMAGAMFASCLVQKKVQGIKNSKGLTVVIMDDNKTEMPALSDALYQGDPWFDGLYQIQTRRRGNTIWIQRSAGDRFDHIINTAFAIKSDHSSLVQVADALSYVYRRYLELTSEDEAWAGEQDYYAGLIELLEPSREKIGRTPNSVCVDFYNQAKHPEWQL